jgi:hypothetical protein
MKKKKKLTSKQQLLIWRIGGILVTFAPILIAVFANKEEYFATKEAGISIGLGGGLALMLIVFSALGKAGKFFDSGFKVITCIFVFALLLEPIILNLKYLSGMMLLGECTNAIFFKPTINRLKKRINREETASVVKEAISG